MKEDFNGNEEANEETVHLHLKLIEILGDDGINGVIRITKYTGRTKSY